MTFKNAQHKYDGCSFLL